MSDSLKLGIMQPYFFPYIGYFQLMNAVDKYVVYDDVNYIKGGRINRNSILIGNEAHFFNLGLLGASPNKLINEIEIQHETTFCRDKVLKTIQMNYSKAPYFKDFFPVLEEIFYTNETNLALFLYNSFLVLKKYMKIETELILSSTIDKDNSLKGVDKVLTICRLFKATEYFNSIGGMKLYQKEIFAKENIDLHFLKVNDELKYKQFNDEFIPNLSIIDVLMFNSVEQVRALLECYTLL